MHGIVEELWQTFCLKIVISIAVDHGNRHHLTTLQMCRVYTLRMFICRTIYLEEIRIVACLILREFPASAGTV